MSKYAQRVTVLSAKRKGRNTCCFDTA
jgi:hypothetical protein